MSKRKVGISEYFMYGDLKYYIEIFLFSFQTIFFFRLDVITNVRDLFKSLHTYEMLLKNFKAKLFIFSLNIRWKLIYNLIIHSFSQNEQSCKTFIFIFYIKIIYFVFIFLNVYILIRLFLNSHYENDFYNSKHILKQ